MTQQDKLIKQLVRLAAQMGDDLDFLLGHVHEFGPHTSRSQTRVARRAVALRASVEKLRLIAASTSQSLSGKAK